MTASGTTDNLEDKAARQSLPAYRHTATRLAELEQAIDFLKTWRDIGEKRDAALQMRVAALEIENTRLSGLVDELMGAMERLGVPRHPK